MMTTIWLDVRHAARALVTHLRFSTLVVLSLGLGIGSNTMLFSIANGVLLRPLPYRDPGTLVTLWEAKPENEARTLVSAADFVEWSGQSRTIEQMAAYRPWGFVLTGNDQPERVPGARISAGLLPLLGVEPVLGRTFLPEEDRFGGRRVVLVGEAFWQRRFGADPQLPGTSLVLNNDTYRVVGVLPRSFRLPEADLYVPLALEPYALQQRGNRALAVVGRLTPGATLAQAQDEMRSIAAGIAARFPDASKGWTAAIVRLDEQLVGGVRLTVVLVWGAVGVVLLIAGANAGNLMLARAGTRRREIAVCLALGATRARIVRRLLTESLLLAVVAGVVGFLSALLGTRLFVALAPSTFPRLYDVRLDAAGFVFALVASVVVGAVFGAGPALRSSRLEGESALNERTAIAGPVRARLSHLSLVVQIALAVCVLICAGLLVRSFRTVLTVDAGFDSRNVLAMTISLPQPKYDDAGRRAVFFRQLLQRAEQAPGVAGSALISHIPLRGARLTGDVALEGRGPSERAADPGSTVEYVVVSQDVFHVLNIPIVRGRAFTDRDAGGAPLVVIVNATMARRFWPGADPLGQRVVVGATLGADRSPRTIVGVVGDVRSTSLEAEPEPAIYLPYYQNPWPTMTLVTRTIGDPSRLAGVLRQEVLALDANQPVSSVMPLDQIVAGSMAPRRFQMSLVSVFAGLALVLAMLGVYGVASYSVGLRTQEFGVRVAMGARPWDILRLALGRAVGSAGLGIVIGVAIAVPATRSFRAALFGVAPIDPLTFLMVPMASVVVVLVAGGLAGVRATRVDPVVAMRR